MRIAIVCLALCVLHSQSFIMFGGRNSDDVLNDYLTDLKTVSIEDPYFQQFNNVHQYGKAHFPLPTKFTFIAKYPSIAYTSIDGEYLLDLSKIINGYPVYINNQHSKFIGKDVSGQYTVSELSKLSNYLSQAENVNLNGGQFGTNDPIQISQWVNYTVFTPLYCPLAIRSFQLKLTGTKNNGNNDGTYTLDSSKTVNGLPVYVNQKKQRFMAVDTGSGAWTIAGIQYLAAAVTLSASQHYNFSGFYSATNGAGPI